MREIKFRAWDKRQKQMSQTFTIAGLTQYEHTFEVKFITFARFKDLIWLEYTGLKDKNSKEIYEGDIIKTRTGCSPVKWEQGQCQWVFPEQSGLEYVPLYWAATHEREVIGNIYENKELLKEVKGNGKD